MDILVRMVWIIWIGWELGQVGYGEAWQTHVLPVSLSNEKVTCVCAVDLP